MFYIMEIQTYMDGTSAHIMKTAQDRNSAEAEFHSTLAFAATSNVYCHAVCIIATDGTIVKTECYWHIPEPE